MRWLIPAAMVIALGLLIVAVLYGTPDPAPSDPTGIELDIDRAKPRPPLKRS